MDPDLPDYRQGDRAGPIVIADPYRWWPALGVLVAQPKRRRHTGFLLESGEPDPLTLALTRSRIRPCAQCPPAIHGGFLEHLLTHLPPPRQPGHPRLGCAIGADGEHPTRILGFLPCVERVDQIKLTPRHHRVRVGLPLGECGF